jgi:hypothetical protein
MVERFDAETARLGLPMSIRLKGVHDVAVSHSNGNIGIRTQSIYIISMANPDDENITLEVELTPKQVGMLVAGMQLARLGRTQNLEWVPR